MKNENFRNGGAIHQDAAASGAAAIDTDSDSDSDPEAGSGAAGRPSKPLEPTRLRWACFPRNGLPARADPKRWA